MNAILATAALHLTEIDPSKTEFVDAHRRYYNGAITAQREAVNEINVGNADALCLTASLINMQALAVPPESHTYALPSVWLDIATGNVALFTTS